MKEKILLFLFITVLFMPTLHSQERWHKWQRASGKWEITNSIASEKRGNAIQWNYYELLNHNSIHSLQTFSGFTSLDVSMKTYDRIETPSETMISFAVTSESQQWYYHMYAFKLTGGFWGINKASFIHSDRLDKSKPFNTKNNIFVQELASTDCKVKYDKMYNYSISFEGTNVVLYINGEKILAAPFPEKSHDGRIAISARNVKISVDKVEIRQKDKVIFEDDFNEDSIYVRTLKVTREPVPKEDEAKKPE